jgi:PST family polysaccharide transporter
VKDIRYFFSGVFTVGLGSVFSLLTPLITIPYLVKTVGLSNYGLSVIVFSICMTLSIIIDFGFNITGLNRIAKDVEKKGVVKTIISITACKLFLFSIILAISALAFFLIQDIRNYEELFLWSLIVPFSSIFNFNWALQGLEKLKELAIITLLSKVIYLGGVFGLIFEPDHYVYINAIFGAGTLVSGLFAASILFKGQPINAKGVFQKSSIIKELKSSYHYFISNLSINLSSMMFPAIVGLFTSSEMAGVYSIVEKVYNFSRAVFSIYQTIMLPRISKLVESAIPSAIKALKNTYVFAIIFVVLEATVLVVFNQQIVLYFTTEHVELTKDLLLMSVVGLLFVAVNCPFYMLLIALDMKTKIMKTFFVLSLFTILCCCCLLYLFGVIGALLTLIITEALYSVLMILIWKTRK